MVAYSKLQYLLAGVGRRAGRSYDEVRRTQAVLLPSELPMSNHAIDTAQRRHEHYGNAGRRKRRVDVGTLSLHEKAVLLRSLAENSTLYSVSGADTLQQRVQAVSGRTIPCPLQ